MRIASLYALLGAFMLAGCGTQIPDMNQAPADKPFLPEVDLIRHLKCELNLGARDALRQYSNESSGGNGVDWIRKWQAKVALKLVVDDTTTLNPGITLKQPMQNAISHFVSGNVTAAQSFSLGLGAQVSSQATRTEITTFTVHFDDLLKNQGLADDLTDCKGHGRIPILGDLKIKSFMMANLGTATVPDALPNNGKDSPFDALSYQTTFIVTLAGSANPSWNLVHFTGNNAGNNPLFNAMRKRTQDVLITMGPIDSKDAAALYEASLIGAYIRSAASNP